MHDWRDESTTTGKIRAAIRMRIPVDQQSEALDILNSVRLHLQFEPSCRSSRIYRDADEVQIIMVEELWESREALMRHLASDAYRRILIVIEMAAETPEIRFDAIAGTSGLETIARARTKA
jgi:quinol monooxygenase YgiN